VVYILREDLTTVEKTGVCCRVAARIGLAESSGISGVRCERYTERRRLTVVAHLSAPQLNKRATRPTIERKGRGTGPTEADLARVKVSFALFLFLFFSIFCFPFNFASFKFKCQFKYVHTKIQHELQLYFYIKYFTHLRMSPICNIYKHCL
jgi:hypothetical protein